MLNKKGEKNVSNMANIFQSFQPREFISETKAKDEEKQNI